MTDALVTRLYKAASRLVRCDDDTPEAEQHIRIAAANWLRVAIDEIKRLEAKAERLDLVVIKCEEYMHMDVHPPTAYDDGKHAMAHQIHITAKGESDEN